jgi:hypothetical protein
MILRITNGIDGLSTINPSLPMWKPRPEPVLGNTQDYRGKDAKRKL